MAYSITLRSPDGEETTFDCAEDENILDALEDAELDHPLIVHHLVVQVHVLHVV